MNKLPSPARRTAKPKATSLLPFLLLLALPLLLPACRTLPAPTAAEPQAGIDQIMLLAMPVALDLDPTPGPDGFAIRVYAGGRAHPKPVPISHGALEILMFDGAHSSIPRSVSPAKTWTFPASDLAPHLFESSIGAGYKFILNWGPDKPTRSHLTVLVRYLPLHGPPIHSAPSSISLGSTAGKP